MDLFRYLEYVQGESGVYNPHAIREEVTRRTKEDDRE